MGAAGAAAHALRLRAAVLLRLPTPPKALAHMAPGHLSRAQEDLLRLGDPDSVTLRAIHVQTVGEAVAAGEAASEAPADLQQKEKVEIAKVGGGRGGAGRGGAGRGGAGRGGGVAGAAAGWVLEGCHGAAARPASQPGSVLLPCPAASSGEQQRLPALTSGSARSAPAGAAAAGPTPTRHERRAGAAAAEAVGAWERPRGGAAPGAAGRTRGRHAGWQHHGGLGGAWLPGLLAG